MELIENKFDDSQNNKHKNEINLEELARRFANFRARNQVITRIPDALRVDAVAALRQGIPKKVLRRSCGITTAQLTSWQQIGSPKKIKKAVTIKNRPPRIFSVKDKNRTPHNNIEAKDNKPNLELRLGDWSICVKQL